MTDEIPKFRGSPEELAVAIESMMLRLTDLVNQADDYDLEELKDIEVGVWFLIGQALAIMGKAKRLLLGEAPETVAAEWLEFMEEHQDPELEAARKAVAMLNSMILSGESHSDQSRKVVAEILKTEESDA